MHATSRSQRRPTCLHHRESLISIAASSRSGGDLESAALKRLNPLSFEHPRLKAMSASADWAPRPSEGPCTFPPFARRSNSKTNSEKRMPNFHYSFWNFRVQIEKRKSIFHYSFWNFRSKTKSGSQVSAFRFGTYAPNRKAKVNFSQFVLELFYFSFRNKSEY